MLDSLETGLAKLNFAHLFCSVDPFPDDVRRLVVRLGYRLGLKLGLKLGALELVSSYRTGIVELASRRVGAKKPCQA